MGELGIDLGQLQRIPELWGMQREQVTVDIFSARDSPVIPVTIEEEFASISVGSSSVSKKKRGGCSGLAPQH